MDGPDVDELPPAEVLAQIADILGFDPWPGEDTRADFVESEHPRDKSGKWTSGGGGSETAEAYISPNVGTSLTFEGARAALSGHRQLALGKVSSRIDRQLGLNSTGANVIGAWADGAENTLMVTTSGCR